MIPVAEFVVFEEGYLAGKVKMPRAVVELAAVRCLMATSVERIICNLAGRVSATLLVSRPTELRTKLHDVWPS